jgi:hypothetical protein
MCGPCSFKGIDVVAPSFVGYANDSSLQHHLWNVCLTQLQSAAAVPKLQIYLELQL